MTGHSYRRYRGRKRTFRNQDLGPVRHPRDEPLHHLLPLHALLQRLRRRPRLRRVRPAQPGVLRPRRGRHAGERVQRQPRRGLPHRRVRRQDRSRATTRASGTCRRRPSVCPHCGLGCNDHARRRATASCAACRAATTATSTRCSSATAAASATSSSTRRERVRASARRRGAGGAMRAADAPEARPPLGECARSSRSDARRGAAARPPRHRHRLAARLAGGQLRAARAGRRRTTSTSACPSATTDLVGAVLEIAARPAPAAAAALPTSHGADAVLVLGEDLTNTAPMLDLTVRTWLRLRPNAVEERNHIRRWNDAGIGAHQAPRAERRCGSRRRTRPSSTRSPPRRWRAAPDDLARLALAVAHEVDAEAPAVARPRRRRAPSVARRWAGALARRRRAAGRRRLLERLARSSSAPRRSSPRRSAAPARAERRRRGAGAARAHRARAQQRRPAHARRRPPRRRRSPPSRAARPRSPSCSTTTWTAAPPALLVDDLLRRAAARRSRWPRSRTG